MNLEDSRAGRTTLLDPEQQAERIIAGREAAAAAGVPGFLLNARTDVFRSGTGDRNARTGDVVARAERYAKAGADCLFVPGLLDLAGLAAVTAGVALPVNAMAGPGGPSVRQLAAAGIRRISVGTAIAQAAYGLAEQATRELLEGGTYGSLARGLAYPEVNALLGASAG